MFLAWSADNVPVKAQTWLVRALGLCWVGDVLLLYPGLFVPGLVAFLVAHLCYLKLVTMDAKLLPSRSALLRCLLAGALMYSVLFLNGLPMDMRIPVGLYVAVIALMAAQAWGRRMQLQDSGSLLTAVGATLFMLSDSVLAIDKFVSPLPYPGLWVMASYYAAQALIVTGMLRSLQAQADMQKKPARQLSQFRNT
jgi:uncharacterized membrane protein YhhN